MAPKKKTARVTVEETVKPPPAEIEAQQDASGSGGADADAGDGLKRSGSGVNFSDTLSVGVASSTTKPTLAKGYKKLKAKAASSLGGKAAKQAAGSAEPAATVQQLPVPPLARFDSSAVPSRPALKSGGSLPGPMDDPQQQQQQQQPMSAGGAAFLAALGGTPAAALDPSGSMGGAAISNPLFDPDGRSLDAPAPAGPDEVGVLRAQYSTASQPPLSFDNTSQQQQPPAGPSHARVSFDTEAARRPGVRIAKDHHPELQPADTALEVDQEEAPGGDVYPSRDDAASTAASSVIVPPGSSQPLPALSAQLTPRAVLTGLLVGCGFAVLAQRLVLFAGLTPSFQVAMAFVSWVLLKAFTFVIGRDISCIPALESQEVAVASAVALACAGSVVAGGFGSVAHALSTAGFAAAGGAKGANSAADVVAWGYGQGVAWLLLVGVAGGLLVVPFRRQLLSRPSVVFPTGAAAGHLINTLQTPGMSYHGRKQMARFTQWWIISFVISGYQWVFNNPICDGFVRFPTFGEWTLWFCFVGGGAEHTAWASSS
jgi:hypothetical protein